MCVQIKPIPSTLCVFGAGTQYGFKENRGCRNAGIQKKRGTGIRVENSWEC